jgi:S-DNA-T family DNA segregation ATPase FtsK/SpoIIIE
MKYFLRAFTPTKNRRLNELVGFLLFVCATLLFLALASYSPLDPSLNTAGSLSSGSAHNWIGLFGAMLSDLLLQSIGVFVFAAPLMIGLLGARWFKSRPVNSPGAKALVQVQAGGFSGGQGAGRGHIADLYSGAAGAAAVAPALDACRGH